MAHTEEQHHLDYVMDRSQAHWDWVVQILSLYRAAPIYSNGTYKIIVDRADLPVRQVFHAGNTVPGKTDVKIGGNPVKPNQANVTYSDQNMGYIQNTIFVQDSVSIYVDLEPIKPMDLSLRGITRPTEAIRQGSVFLRKNIDKRIEVTWATGLEGLAVEPGDRCKVGVAMTNYEAGFGGRALDGSSTHIVFDREVTINSGYTYDLLVWHTEADTLETRTLPNSPGAHAVGYPTSGFSYKVEPMDRWAVGINSEDLFDVRVLSVQREADGMHILSGEQFLPITFAFECPDTRTSIGSASVPPSQPRSLSVTVSNCTICVDMRTAPMSEGGTVTAPGTIFPAATTSYSALDIMCQISSNAAYGQENMLFGDYIVFTTGPASGRGRQIEWWTPEVNSAAGGLEKIIARTVWWSPPLATPPNSGDSFYIQGQSVAIAGFRVMHRTNQSDKYEELGQVQGTSGCVEAFQTFSSLTVLVIPFNARGFQNKAGARITTLQAPGCDDFNFISDPVTRSGSASNLMYGVVLPGSQMGLRNILSGRASMFLTECCSAADETTDLRFDLEFSSVTLVQSFVVPLNTTTSLATITLSGQQLPVTLEFSIQQLNNTARQLGTLKYVGFTDGGSFQELMKTGIGSINTQVPNSLGIRATFFHTSVNTPTLPHSHNCFNLVADNVTFTVTNIDSGEGIEDIEL